MRVSMADLNEYPLWRSNQGWRARIGVIYPGPGWHHIGDFHKLAPKGVAIGGMGVPRHKDESAQEMLHLDDQVVEKSKLFISYHPDVIVWNCTAGSFLKGKDHDAKLIKEMEEATKTTCTTTSTSLVAAFKKMGVEKLSICTPYPNDVNEVEKKYFEDNGFLVPNIIGLDLVDNNILANLSPSVIYKLAKKADVPKADAVFISCTGLDALDVIEALEQDLGKPVFTSNQATYWNAFRLAKIGEPINGYGRLMRESRL